MDDVRSLTPGEIALARGIFGGNIDYSTVSVISDRVLPTSRWHAPDGNIYIPEGALPDYSISGVRDEYRATLIHELVHVWQKQMGMALELRRGANGSYDYDKYWSREFKRMPIEAQAQLVEDYYRLKIGLPPLIKSATVRTLEELRTKIPKSLLSPVDPPKCLAANCLVLVAPERSVPIWSIAVNDVVLAYESIERGRYAPVQRRITSLYRNTTTEWFRLTWKEEGEWRELVSTPGHHFLDQFGNFPTIAEMTKDGRATVVLASGALAEVTVERIVYSAETAHMFERAVAYVDTGDGTAAKPVELDCWQTYNIEVEDLHTYIAGGVRVHNDSGILGQIGNVINSIDEALDVKDGGLFDIGTDFVSGVFHMAGEIADIPRSLWDRIVHWRDYVEAEKAAKEREVQVRPITRDMTDQERVDRLNWNSAHDGEDGTTFHQTEADKAKSEAEMNRGEKDEPILLDLDGDGIEITSLDKSTRFVDAGGQGLKHRTAWAGNGDGVLFVDADGNGQLSNSHEYIFTEWDASAQDDMAALRSAFDTNGDGKLTPTDARWSEFRVLRTNANGLTEVKTLADLNITEINLKRDTTHIDLPDGSTITGQAGFTIGGVTRTAANVSLMAEARGARVVEVVTGASTKTVTSTGLGQNGERLFVVTSVTTADGGAVTNSWDMNGDGVFERVQRITTVVDAGTGVRTETEQNWRGATVAGGVKDSRTVTVTSADGKQVTISRDHDWGGWFDEREVQETLVDGSRSVLIEKLTLPDPVTGAQVVISATKSVISANGLERTFYENIDGVGVTGGTGAEVITKTTISQDAAGERTEAVVVKNTDTSVRGSETLVVSANGLTRTTTTDLDGDGAWDVMVKDTTVQVAGGGTTTEVKVWNANDSLRGQVNSSVSADGLVTTRLEDIDGLAGWERKTTETVVIDDAGTRTTTVHVRNFNDSTNSLTKTVLGTDKVTREEWVDLNGDGTIGTGEKVLQVAVEAGTNDRLTSNWIKAPDGTVVAVTTDRTTQDGLTSTRTLDAENDGDVDRIETDLTAVTGGVSTRTVTVTTGDMDTVAAGNQLDVIGKTETTVSADALTVTTKRDIGGTDDWDAQEVTTRSTAGNGSITVVKTALAGNGSTVLARETTVTSANRLAVTVTTDTDGGAVTMDRRIQDIIPTALSSDLCPVA